MKSPSIIKTILVYIAMITVGMMAVNTGRALQAQETNPGETAAKCVAAMGGEKALRGMMDYKAEGEALYYYGKREIKAKLTEIRKGKKYRSKSELTFRGNTRLSVNAYNGKQTAWAERRGTVTNQPALKYQSDLAHTPLQMVEPGATYTSVEGVEIDGKQTLGVEVAAKGKRTLFYFDPDDYTLREIRYKDYYFGENDTKEQMEMRIQYSRYKEVGGNKFPHRQVFYKNGKKQKEILFKTVTPSPVVKNDIFERPEQETDFRYSDEKIH
jgi:hypothetical protein